MLNPLYIVEIVIGGISILSSFLNIAGFILVKNVRTEASELIFCLSIACIMTNISYIINFTENIVDSKNAVCQVQGFLMMWFEVSEIIWATLISYSVYNNIINNDNDHNNIKRFKYALFGFILPLFASLAVLLSGQIGYAKYWCWIDKTSSVYISKSIYLAIFSFFWFMFLLSFYFIYKVIGFLEKNYTNKTEKELIYKYINTIRLYPIIQAISMIPATLTRIFQVFELEYIFLDYLNVIFISLQGFLYGLIFGFNPIIKNRVKEIFQKYCNCCLEEEKERDSKPSLSTELTKNNL